MTSNELGHKARTEDDDEEEETSFRERAKFSSLREAKRTLEEVFGED